MEKRLIEIDYRPRYPQVHRILESHRFVVLVAHRRFGKTVLSINHLLKQALLCRHERGNYAYVAPLRNQAKVIAWRYLKHYSAPVPGRNVNESELAVSFQNGATIRLFGADNPDALRGQYFDGVILDEVAQMKGEVWGETIQPALADRGGWALFIGTPKGVNLFSELYFDAVERQERGDPNWAALSFPVTETDALPPEEVERLRGELSDNAFRQEMLCDFAASSDNVLISLDEVAQAMGRNVDLEAAAAWPLVVGVDVARFGEDSTVFFPRRGLHAYQPDILRKLSNTDVAHRLTAYIAERKPGYVCIDQGQGTGVIDLVRDLTASLPVRVIEVPFGSKATADDRFVNRRAEMWTAVRDWLRAGGRLPASEALKAELTAPTYSYDAAGRIKLEPKEEVKKRLNGRSTDISDALALTFAVPVSADRASIMPSLDERYGVNGARGAREWLTTGRDEAGYDFWAGCSDGRDGYDPFS